MNTFYMNVERVYADERIERFKVSAIKNPASFIILENNRPFFRVVKKLKHRKIDWIVYRGEEYGTTKNVWNRNALEKAIEEIRKVID